LLHSFQIALSFQSFGVLRSDFPSIFIGRMVQHIMPQGFHRVRYYGLESTKSFKKWAEVIRQGIKKLGKGVKGVYEIVRKKKYRERYEKISGKDPMKCRCCGGCKGLFENSINLTSLQDLSPSSVYIS
jgi:hypothetical protein